MAGAAGDYLFGIIAAVMVAVALGAFVLGGAVVGAVTTVIVLLLAIVILLLRKA
jgi:hypothetical protein